MEIDVKRFHEKNPQILCICFNSSFFDRPRFCLVFALFPAKKFKIGKSAEAQQRNLRHELKLNFVAIKTKTHVKDTKDLFETFPYLS